MMKRYILSILICTAVVLPFVLGESESQMYKLLTNHGFNDSDIIDEMRADSALDCGAKCLRSGCYGFSMNSSDFGNCRLYKGKSISVGYNTSRVYYMIVVELAYYPYVETALEKLFWSFEAAEACSRRHPFGQLASALNMDEYEKMIDSVKTLMQGKSTGASFWVNAYPNDKSGKQFQRWLNGTGPLVDRSLWYDPESLPEGKCVYLYYSPSNTAYNGLSDEYCFRFRFNPLCETRP